MHAIPGRRVHTLSNRGSYAKIFSFFIETVFWIQLFISPVGIGSLIALAIYLANEKWVWLSIAIIVVSVGVGIMYAESVRKKQGTFRYASKILNTPDIWPDEYPDETEAREAGQQKKEGPEEKDRET